ncbi:hypothetical protein [Streptomyces sp. SPB78]|uniref:hypothetical protein n=1 Tax=Streptomyces sp. (strain SPB78) TaxID=591157 RepID=UPI0007C7847C|nr:hypothetical protein [Streptomyces sp. SPB78]
MATSTRHAVPTSAVDQVLASPVPTVVLDGQIVDLVAIARRVSGGQVDLTALERGIAAYALWVSGVGPGEAATRLHIATETYRDARQAFMSGEVRWSAPLTSVAPCPSKSAKRRHRSSGELCFVCWPGAGQPTQELVACPSKSAKDRHRKRGETCFTCWPAAGVPSLVPCPSLSAKKRHRLKGESCATCGMENGRVVRRVEVAA